MMLLVPISTYEPTVFSQKLATTSATSPVVHVGDTWYYQYSGPEGNSKESITGFESCGERSCVLDQETNSAWNDTVWVDRNWNLSREIYVDHTMQFNQSSTFTPPLHLYQFPLTIGKTWWSNSSIAGWYTDQFGNHTQSFNVAIARTVINQTTVTVPAGTFDTFLVAQYLNDLNHLVEYRWFSLTAKTTVKFMVFEVATGSLRDSYMMTSYSLATVKPVLSITSLSPNPARPGQPVRLDYSATDVYGNVTATWVDWGDNSIPDLVFNMTSESMCQRTNPSLNSNDCTIPHNSLVLAQAQKDPSAIVNGSIVIFRPYPQEPAYLVMHRVIKVIPPTSAYGPYTFWTQGDANLAPDPWDSTGGITSNQIIGVYKSTLTLSGPGERYDTHAYPDQGSTSSRSYTIIVNATDENDTHAQTSISETVTQNSQPLPTPTPPHTVPPISPFIFFGIAAAAMIAISVAVLLVVASRKKTGQSTDWNRTSQIESAYP